MNFVKVSNTFLKLFCFSILVGLIQSKTLCYDGYGCFTDEYPFGNSLARPLSLLPESPEKIGTKYYLWNRKTDDELISLTDLGNGFNASIPTKFIIHGWIDNGKLPWIIDLKDALLEKIDCNVISVDWVNGATFPYTQATANTQLVGAEVAKLILELKEKKNLVEKDVHLIGHSLGAHISGYAGKKVPGLGRISGLDPAAPYFEGTPEIVRLCKNDADYVDIIHTNAKKIVGSVGSLGIKDPIGHVDYFPNGAETQPGCTLSDLNFDPSCSHLTSQAYYIDSVKTTCPYQSFRCDSYEKFLTSECIYCGPTTCNNMGYWSSPKAGNGSQYLQTQSYKKGSNLCLQAFQITLSTGNHEDKKAKGKFTIYLQTATQTTSSEILDNGNIVWSSYMSKKLLVSMVKQVTEPTVERAFISYEKASSWTQTYEDTWAFESINVYSSTRQINIQLCPVDSIFGERKTIEYGKC